MKKALCRNDLKDAIEHLESFVSSANCESDKNCGCFSRFTFDERQKIKRHIPIYLDSWVLPQLKRVLDELER